MNNVQTICFGCMRRREPQETICPVCGYHHGWDEAKPYVLQPGSYLHDGKYLVGKVLGQGGFGITYIGLDTALELKVAIKEYYPSALASRRQGDSHVDWHSISDAGASGRESFLKEARKMAKLSGIPGIARVSNIFYQNNTAYIIMNFIDGETLKAKLLREGAMTPKECVETLRPAMEALQLAHQDGMIHRDISPDNIMIDPKGTPWILDMGAAKDLETGQRNETQTSQAVVKHGFSPPEQIVGRDIGPWTDVYSMCATIYWCLTGRVPPDAVDRLLDDTLQFPETIPADISTVLKNGMEVRPENRIRSMQELQNQLEDAVRPKPQKSPKPKRLLPYVIAAVLILASAIGIVAFRHRPDTAVHKESDTVAESSVSGPSTPAVSSSTAEKETVSSAAGEEEEAKEEWVELFYGSYNNYGNVYESSYTKNSDGQNVEILYHRIYSNGSETLEHRVNRFDDAGHVIGSETRDAATGQLIRRTEAILDEEGRAVRNLEYRADGTLYSEQKNSFSSAGHVSEMIYYDDNENYKSRNVTEYDENDNPVRYEYYDINGEISTLETTEYDVNGHKTSGHKTSFVTTGDNYEYSVHYEYNNDLLVKSVTKQLTGYATGSETEEINTYDSYGNLLETRSVTDGKVSSRTVRGWGLLKAGEIIETSGEREFDNFDPESYDGSTNKAVSTGKISLTETQVLDYDGVRVTAKSYFADENTERIRFLVENTGNEEVSFSPQNMQLNGVQVDLVGLSSRAEAHSSTYQDIFIYSGILETAGISRLENLILTLQVKKNYETIYTSRPVRIPIQDNRTRASDVIPMKEELISGNDLKVRILGYERLPTNFMVYYSVENNTDETFRMESTGCSFNGEAGSKYSIYDTFNPHSSKIFRATFSKADYTQIKDLRTFEFGVEIENSSYKTIASGESIRWEFDSNGTLTRFSGRINRTS